MAASDQERLEFLIQAKAEYEEIIKARDAIKSFIKTAKLSPEALAKGKSSLRELNKILKKTTVETSKAAKETKKEGKELSYAARGAKAHKKEVQKLTIERHKANTAAKANFRWQKVILEKYEQKYHAIKRVTKIENERLIVKEAEARVAAKNLTLTSDELRQLGIKNQQLVLEAQTREKLEAQKALANSETLRRDRAEIRILQEKNALLDKEAYAAARKAHGLPAVDGVPDESRLRKSTQGVKELNSNLKKTRSLGNRISFTFRRLFGILAAFTIARRLVQAFVESLKAAISFNAQLEQSILGMASLIVSAGKVHTALGPAVTDAQNLALATQEARNQIDKLRTDALQTAASFEDLVSAFQIAITPGLQAGLGLDQIRQLTVRISQAAAAIGLPQRQLAEEIRSLLQGTIRVRDTRVAVALGITNDDIRRAKELGDLGGFLERRFKAFAEAGKLAEQNLKVLFTNTKDALLLLAGKAGEDFFLSVKTILSSIKDSVVALNKETGEIELNPEAVEVAQTFFDALESGVEQALILKDSLSSFQLEQIGNAAASAFSGAFIALRVGLEVFIDSISLVASLLNVVFLAVKGVAAVFKGLDTLSFGAFSGFLKTMLTLGLAIKIVNTAWIAHKIIVKGVEAVYGLYALGVNKLIGTIKLLTLATYSTSASFTALRASAAAFLAPLAVLLTKVVAVASAALVAVSAIRLALSLDVESDNLEKIQKLIDLKKQEKEVISAINNDHWASAEALDAQVEKGRELQFEIGRATEELKALGVSAEDLNLIHAGSDPSDVTNFVERIAADAKHLIMSLGDEIGDLSSSLFGGRVGQSELEKIFENFPKAVSPINRALDQQREKLKGLSEQLDEHLTISGLIAENMGLGSEALAIRIAQAQTELDIRKTTLQLRAEEQSANEAARRAEASVLSAKRKGAKLSEDEQTAITFALDSLKSRKALLDGIAVLEQKILTQKDNAARAESKAEKERISQVIENLEKEIALAEDKAAAAQIFGSSFISAIDSAESRQIVAQIVEDILKGEADLNAALSSQKEILESIEELEKGIRTEAGARAALAATTQTLELKRQTDELALQLRHQKELTRFSTAFTDARSSEKTLIGARHVVELEQQRLEVLRQQQIISDEQFERAISDSNSLIEKNALIVLYLAKQKELNVELGLQNEKLLQSKQILSGLRAQDENPFFTGTLEAVRQLSEEVGTRFSRTVDLMKFAFGGLADTITATITGLFDPSDTTTAKQRFGRFLLQLANMMIAMIVQVALIQKTLLPWLDGLGSVESSNIKFQQGNVGGIGFHEGGAIPHMSGKAQGLKRGGKPKGIHPLDTVPIWAQAGEWMMRLSAVKKYGAGVMKSINDGLIDPGALTALAGSNSVNRTVKANPTPSFRTGGLVSEQSQALASSAPAQEQAGPNVGFVLASENQMDALVNGGSGALMRWFMDNASSLKGALE